MPQMASSYLCSIFRLRFFYIHTYNHQAIAPLIKNNPTNIIMKPMTSVFGIFSLRDNAESIIAITMDRDINGCTIATRSYPRTTMYIRKYAPASAIANSQNLLVKSFRHPRVFTLEYFCRNNDAPSSMIANASSHNIIIIPTTA